MGTCFSICSGITNDTWYDSNWCLKCRHYHEPKYGYCSNYFSDRGYIVKYGEYEYEIITYEPDYTKPLQNNGKKRRTVLSGYRPIKAPTIVPVKIPANSTYGSFTGYTVMNMDTGQTEPNYITEEYEDIIYAKKEVINRVKYYGWHKVYVNKCDCNRQKKA